MFDPTNPNDIARLNTAIDDSITGLESYRKNYNHLRKVLGDPCHTGKPKVENRQVVSKLDEFFTIMTRAVVSRNPSLRIGRTKFPRIAGMTKSQVEAWGQRNDMASMLRDGFHEGLLRWCIGYMSAVPTEQGVEHRQLVAGPDETIDPEEGQMRLPVAADEPVRADEDGRVAKHVPLALEQARDTVDAEATAGAFERAGEGAGDLLGVRQRLLGAVEHVP